MNRLLWQCHGGGMEHCSRLRYVSIPSLGGGRVDQHLSFPLFLFTIYHLFPYLCLQNKVWHVISQRLPDVSFVNVYFFFMVINDRFEVYTCIAYYIRYYVWYEVNASIVMCFIVWTVRTIRAFAFANDWNIRAWKTPLKNDKYHTFEITIYYELNKPRKWKNKQKKTQECLNNICIRFPTYENECYAKRTWILRTMMCLICNVSYAYDVNTSIAYCVSCT